MMIDAHAHLSFLPDQQVDLAIRSSIHRIGLWILGGYNPSDWLRQMEIKSRWPDRVETCFGLHPWLIGDMSDVGLNQALTDLNGQAANADWMGELGLDTSLPGAAPVSRQVEVLEQQLQMAKNHQLACVFHLVGGTAEFFKAFDRMPVHGFVHGFSGSSEVARELIERGLLISVGPGVLKSHFKKLQKTVEDVGLEHLLVESDSPENLSVKSYCGFDSLEEIYQRVSEIKVISRQELEKQVSLNLNRIRMAGSDES